ncbi:hypothetical protein QTO30_13990 [Yoonia sp. GPGPB17]|uniref:hypothetical protein n=1 Tax=Yoonia sp. GPGPB17 TaxID=3026147 RepID=UPI0030C26C26
MQILPKARLQSAAEWLNIINKEGKRVQQLKVSSRFDLEKTLTRLVSETNEYVLNSQPREPQKAPQQVKSVDPEITTSPGWVDEFNQETTETLEEQRAIKKAVAELEAKKAERLAEQERAAWKKKNWWRVGFLKKSPPRKQST